MANRGTVAVTSFLILVSVSSVLGNLVDFPADTVAVVGETVRLPCATDAKFPVNWQHVPVDSKSYEDIYISRVVVLPYYPRFNVSPLAEGNSTTEYHLVIASVSLEDAGQYTCMDQSGHGERRQAQLTVLESSPSCQSNIQSGVFVGENDCGEAPDTIRCSCSLRYSASSPPAMEWAISKEELNETQGSVKEIRTNNTIRAEFTFEASLSVDGTSIIWRLEQHPETNWTSGEIKITYLKSNTSRQVIDHEQLITCSVDNCQTCFYEWKTKDTTVSNESSLNINNAGIYFCEATCLLRENYCKITPLVVEYTSSVEENTNEKTKVVVPVLITIIAMTIIIIVIVVIIIIIRNRKPKQIYKEEMSFLSS